MLCREQACLFPTRKNNDMKRILISILVCIFSLWLMPLTAFVKPSQDKLICDGQRAICLCRHQGGEGKIKPQQQMAAFQSSSTETQKESSGGMSPRFLTRQMFSDALLPVRQFVLSEYRFLYSFRFVPAFEHVPKAA